MCVTDRHDMTLAVKVTLNPKTTNNVILSKLKAFSDDKLDVDKIKISVSYPVGSIVEKGENAGYQHFLLFPQCFQKASPLGSFNSLPNNMVLDLTKWKAFADDKINEAQMMISVFDRVENIVGKGENAVFQHFLLFQQYFQKASFMGSLKVGIMW